MARTRVEDLVRVANELDPLRDALVLEEVIELERECSDDLWSTYSQSVAPEK